MPHQPVMSSRDDIHDLFRLKKQAIEAIQAIQRYRPFGGCGKIGASMKQPAHSPGQISPRARVTPSHLYHLTRFTRVTRLTRLTRIFFYLINPQ
jgi:hypothetical protein